MAITPLWFQLLWRAHELLAGEAFIRLAFPKRIYKWFQVCTQRRASGPWQPGSSSNEPSFQPCVPPSLPGASPPSLARPLPPSFLGHFREKTFTTKDTYLQGSKYVKLHWGGGRGRVLILFSDQSFMFCISVCPSVKW